MSKYIGTAPTPQATQTRQTFTATSGQTTFNTIGYQAGYLSVYLNGVKLVDGTDYTATNGSDVVLTTGAATDDTLEVVAFSTFEVLDQNFAGTTTVDTLNVTGAATGTDLTLSGGVYLGGTGSANKLDDYEEGTWTPVLTTDGTAPSFTYANQKGYYTKVGDQVNIYIYISTTALGSAGTGNAIITGLPFTSNSNIQGGVVSNWTISGWNTNCPEMGHIPTNSTAILLVFYNGTATTRITAPNFDAGFETVLHGSYKAS